MVCWIGWIVHETQRCVGLTVDVWFWLCVSLGFPSTLWNHAQLGGGSDAERLRSTLAYGWVERCSDVASCKSACFQDKYFPMFNFYNVFIS